MGRSVKSEFLVTWQITVTYWCGQHAGNGDENGAGMIMNSSYGSFPKIPHVNSTSKVTFGEKKRWERVESVESVKSEWSQLEVGNTAEFRQ